jgi:hypothetical protein
MAKNRTIQDYVFWGVLIFLSFSAIFYTLLQAQVVSKSLNILLFSSLFFTLWAGSLILGFIVGEEKDLLNYGTFYGNTLWFYIGFFIYLIINVISISSTGNLSIFSIGQNTLYSAIVGDLPAHIDFVYTVILIPIVEELFWIFAIPSFILKLAKGLGKLFPIFNNPFVQLGLIVLIGGVSFVVFHVGKATLILFAISAMIFRSVMIISTIGDTVYDVFKKIEITPAFAVGAHIGNNLANFGLGKAWNVILVNQWIGWIVLLVFGSFFLIMVNGIVLKIRGEQPI